MTLNELAMTIPHQGHDPGGRLNFEFSKSEQHSEWAIKTINSDNRNGIKRPTPQIHVLYKSTYGKAKISHTTQNEYAEINLMAHLPQGKSGQKVR